MELPPTQAIYLQIADLISERILSGGWAEGQRIPSIRELSEQIEVNSNTVMRAYAYLQDLGIIHSQRGVGYFVAQDASRIALELKRKSFVNRELPRLYRTMDLLQFECEDLRALHAESSGSDEEERE